jgi:hypothetical protein
MVKALTKFPCFFPKWKGTLEEFVNLNLSGKKGFILSGDYDAATDNLHSDVMLVVIEELKKVFFGNTYLCSLMDFEAGQHRVTYPKWTGVPDCIQTNGQLMGSLLSFPILCLANAATLAHLLNEDLDEIEACINGDDILFVANLRQIKRWKKIASGFGLIPSIGKNYCSNDFGTINSQLFWRTPSKKFEFIQTGKSKLVVRKDQCLVKHALEAGYTKSQIVTWGKSALQRRPESIDIPSSHGGAGVSFDKADSRDDRILYLYRLSNLLKKKTPVPLEDGRLVFCMPKYLAQIFKHMHQPSKKIDESRLYASSQEDSLLQEVETEFPWKDFKSFRERCKRNQNMREFISHGHLPSAPPLSAFSPFWTSISTQDLKFFENQTDRLLRNTLLSKKNGWLPMR